ncbi:hypothetical protein [Erythrobacter aureus]|uniref:Uncharacterized protein n=1 Tax=Erythrobacter aureus TaxID=2182384 RepID=A0A345YEN8_9SPHN|nr:hypothetical protein [Erythrobacter aureus]AXK42390.1 hypothetical protein DVR09_08630 [Erythrobacter aureus]
MAIPAIGIVRLRLGRDLARRIARVTAADIARGAVQIEREDGKPAAISGPVAPAPSTPLKARPPTA